MYASEAKPLPVGATAVGDVRLCGRALVAARAGWVILAALSVALFLLSLPAYHRQVRAFKGVHQHAPAATRAGLEQLGVPLGFYAWFQTFGTVLTVAVFVIVGLVIFRRRSDDPMMLFTSLTLVVFGAIWPNTMDDLANAHPLLAVPELAVNAIGFCAFFLLFYLFPDGRFVPRWTRWLALGWVVVEATTVVPPGAHPDLGPAGSVVVLILVVLFPGTMLYAQVHRYRRVSTQLQRQQTKLVTFALLFALLSFVATALVGSLPLVNRPGPPAALYDLGSGFVFGNAFMLVPIAIGLAVLRHRLWDIDPIIGHTLVYGALTVCVVGLYVLIMGELGVVFRSSGNFVFSLVAAGLVAVIFQPLRLWLQRHVNRLIYGRRDDPYGVLTNLAARMEGTLAPDALLPTLVETVSEALRLPYAAIALAQEDRFVPVATVGSPVPELLCLPLLYQQQPVGQLWLAPRAPGEAFSQTDRRLLDDLARQAGVAAQAVRLTQSLQQSRERLVLAREEERRRLRRDLHDGLGPRLASLTMRLETAREQLGGDPTADILLADLVRRTQDAVADIRRLVYELRPPSLDELGLVSALQETAAQAGLALTVEAPATLPPLPAAVEVAAFRIGQEALTNVARHAGARHCLLRLSVVRDGLAVEIADDGRGIAAERHLGIGMISMRERAEELGGAFTVESGPSGTTVRALLPCHGATAFFTKEHEEAHES